MKAKLDKLLAREAKKAVEREERAAQRLSDDWHEYMGYPDENPWPWRDDD